MKLPKGNSLLWIVGIAVVLVIAFIKQKTCRDNGTSHIRSTFWFLGCKNGESQIDSAYTSDVDVFNPTPGTRETVYGPGINEANGTY